MAGDEHSLLRENIPAYALGALDAEEVRALEAHLQTCAACQAELAKYRVVSENLQAALPPRMPSPALRKRLQSHLPSAQPAPNVARPRLDWPWSRLAVGSALALLLVMNLFSFLQLRDLQRQQLALLRQSQNSQAALAMLSYPGTEALPIHDAGAVSGTILLDRDRNSVALIAWNLPPLQQSQTYQIWLIQPDGDRVSGGTFRPEADEPYTMQPVFANQDLSRFTGVGVTVEPAGGSDHPTGPRIFKVDF